MPGCGCAAWGSCRATARAGRGRISCGAQRSGCKRRASAGSNPLRRSPLSHAEAARARLLLAPSYPAVTQILRIGVQSPSRSQSGVQLRELGRWPVGAMCRWQGCRDWEQGSGRLRRSRVTVWTDQQDMQEQRRKEVGVYTGAERRRGRWDGMGVGVEGGARRDTSESRRLAASGRWRAPGTGDGTAAPVRQNFFAA